MVDVDTIKEIIEKDDINEFRAFVWLQNIKDEKIQGYNLLQYAITQIAVKIVEFILDTRYYDINKKASDGSTAIVLAMNDFLDESVDIVKLIFRYYPDVDVDIPDLNGSNALLAGLMSGIGHAALFLVAEKTKNLEQIDIGMNETVVQACLRNNDMYRKHAQILVIYINKGAIIDERDIKNIMLYTKGTGRKNSSVWKAIDKRDDLTEKVIKVAVENEYQTFMPETIKYIFIF